MSLTANNLRQFVSNPGTPSGRSQLDAQSRSSQKSLRVSQQDGFFGRRQSQGPRVGISDQKKLELHQTYEDLNKGSMSKNQFVKKVKEDIGLRTNPYFEKALQKVDFSYGEVIKGVDKKYREENQNLKPNTCDPAIITGQDATVSVGKYQEKFLSIPSSEKNDDIQKQCLKQVNRLVTGQVHPIQFQKQCQERGLSTDLFDKELRELNASNQCSYSKIGHGLYRALEEQRSRKMNASLIGLNDHPTRGDWVYQFNHKADSAAPSRTGSPEKSQIGQQYRSIGIPSGNMYYETKRSAPAGVYAALNNGDILTWKRAYHNSIPQIDPPSKQRITKHNESSFKLEDYSTFKHDPHLDFEPKKKNLKQMLQDIEYILYFDLLQHITFKYKQEFLENNILKQMNQ